MRAAACVRGLVGWGRGRGTDHPMGQAIGVTQQDVLVVLFTAVYRDGLLISLYVGTCLVQAHVCSGSSHSTRCHTAPHTSLDNRTCTRAQRAVPQQTRMCHVQRAGRVIRTHTS